MVDKTEPIEARQEDEEKQQFHKLHKSVGHGEDDYGPYELIPLSMMRGGALEEFKVHTKPMRHVILDQNIPPRGWYKSKWEGPRVRSRPCFSEATLSSPYGGACHINCAFCVSGDTLVSTPEGDTRIEDIVVGDVVWGRTNIGAMPATVIGRSAREVSNYYDIKLDTGSTLHITGEHPVYVLGQGWTKVEELRAGQRLEPLQTLRQTVRLSDQGQANMRRLSANSCVGDCGAFECDAAAQDSREECSQDVRALWQSYRQAKEEVLPRLQHLGQGQSSTLCGKSCRQSWPQICRDAPTYEGGYDTQDFGWEQSCCRMPEVFGVAQEDSSAHVRRENGLQGQQAWQIQTKGWADNNFPLYLGVLDSAIYGCPGLGMGIREASIHIGAGSIHTGFSYILQGGARESSRGQGLLPYRKSREDGEIYRDVCCAGRDDGSMGSVAIVGIKHIASSMVAYDIQTVTENFYAEGVLIHNCYVAHGTRGYRATGLPTVDPAYPDKMRKNMQKVMVSGAGYMTSFTEPFQRLEGTYHITQRLTQMFMDEGLPFFYCTRLLPPDWAIEALTQNPYNYIQWSVNTSNQDLYKRLSPGAARLEDILTTASELNGYGVYTSFQVNPVLAGIVTLEELLILVDLAAEAKVNHLIFKFAEQVYSNRGLLMDRMHSTRLPEGRVAEFDRLLNQTIGGVYTIQQDVRLEWLDELLKRTRERGVTMSTCYEYYDDGHAGANYGPYILTSRGGCHGQSIPMYFRPESGAPFEPLPGCFESGCLYCEEYGTAVCGNALMLSATKLEFKDLRSVQLKGEDINWHLPGSAPSPDYVAEYDNWYPGKKTFAEYYDMRP